MPDSPKAIFLSYARLRQAFHLRQDYGGQDGGQARYTA